MTVLFKFFRFFLSQFLFRLDLIVFFFLFGIMFFEFGALVVSLQGCLEILSQLIDRSNRNYSNLVLTDIICWCVWWGGTSLSYSMTEFFLCTKFLQFISRRFECTFIYTSKYFLLFCSIFLFFFNIYFCSFSRLSTWWHNLRGRTTFHGVHKK